MFRNFIRRLVYKNQSFFLLPRVRRSVVDLRFIYYAKIKKKLQFLDSKNAFDVTVSHNLKGLRDCNDRMKLLVQPLVCIEKVRKDSKVLVIGPRNENDLLLLFGNGMTWANLIGLDLISYSPRIILGDMHDIPFESNYFDIVLCGWTLGYSATPGIAATEMVRVIKKGGIIGIGMEYSTLTKDDIEILLGYSIQDYDKLPKRINSSPEILSLFQGYVEHVFFNHDAPNKISHTRNGYDPNVSNVATIFSITK